MRIAIGADDAGFPLKEMIRKHLVERGYEPYDYGVHSGELADYPDIGFPLANGISEGQFDRGILICGTGIGMSITANKVPGIRAALCHDVYSAERARKSNNAQILTMGARVIGPELAKTIVDAWLISEFEDGLSTRKVQKIQTEELSQLEGEGVSKNEQTSR